MEDPSEKTRRRLVELKRKHGACTAKAQLYHQSRRKADRVTATADDQHQLIKQQHQANKRACVYELRSESRRASRRAMNAMKKTVEIADGSSDFHSLMVAAYGKGILRYWNYAKDVFEDITGLKLIQETESEEDS